MCSYSSFFSIFFWSIFTFFSRMRSEGFSFYILGVWVTLLLASASVCKRPPAAVVGAKLPCLWEKSQKRDFFDVSEAVVMSFCVAGVALRGAILWLHFQTMCYVFRGRRSTWIPPMSFCVAGAAFWTCRVACFLRIALSALREVVTRCKFRSRRGIL